jgi:hypothetical protein
MGFDMSEKKISNCLICGSQNLQNLDGYQKDHLCTCNNCAFVFSNINPSQEELDKVYGGYSREVLRTEITKKRWVRLH